MNLIRAAFYVIAISAAVVPAPIAPVLITEPVPHDSEDPAIWVNRADPAKSLVLATDKNDADGALMVYDLDGREVPGRSVHGLKRPNNVDVEYGFAFGSGAGAAGGPASVGGAGSAGGSGGGTIDIAVTTERVPGKLRVHRLPDMTAIDGGGIDVFVGVTQRLPMGIALYKRPRDGAVFAIVSRSVGPTNGHYLWEYRLTDNGHGQVVGEKVREFGIFSGKKTMESLAVDDELGFVYASDEQVGVRKYYADPDRPAAEVNQELALFATTGFVDDHEGISIYQTGPGTGFLLISDQGARRFQLFRREGEPGKPHAHPVVRVVPVAAFDSDGSDITNVPLSPRFPKGLFVAMSGDRTYHFYSAADVLTDLLRPTPRVQ